jgi:hypothetical protein
MQQEQCSKQMSGMNANVFSRKLEIKEQQQAAIMKQGLEQNEILSCEYKIVVLSTVVIQATINQNIKIQEKSTTLKFRFQSTQHNEQGSDGDFKHCNRE